MQNSDDSAGRKPYKTYKSGRAKRRASDEELFKANAHPPRQPIPKAGAAHPPRQTTGSHNGAGYTRYSSPAAQRPQTNGSPGGGGARRPPSRRRIRWWAFPVGILVIMAIAGVVLTVMAWPGYRKFDRAVVASNERIDEDTRSQLTPDKGGIWRKGTTILLLGADSKMGEPARSDTIMLMRFNPRARTINQLSIPRDTRVLMPNGSYDKINAAMFWGGPSGAVRAVKDYLGIEVNHVMVVNFQGFPRLVNAVGGVDINVPKTVTTVAGSNRRTVVFKEGMNHMDGKNAMLYVRIRYADDDVHRAERQQQFVQALQKKIAQPSNIPDLPEIGSRFMSGTATDLTTSEILQLGFLKWYSKGGKKMVMVGTPGWEGGVSYMYPPSETDKQKLVRRFLTK